MENKDLSKKELKKIKRHNTFIKVMNYYYENTINLFRWGLIAISILGFIYLVYIFLPEDTRNGVEDNYLISTNQEKIGEIFTISEIPDKYKKEQAIAYTDNIIKYMYKKDNQYVYKEVLNFLNRICSTKMNQNTFYLYKKLYDEVNKDGFNTKLNSDNIIRKSSLKFCEKDELIKIEEVVGSNPNSWVANLEKEKIKILGRLELIEKQKEISKEAYGKYFDEKTGGSKYQSKSYTEFKKEQLAKENEESLKNRLEYINNLLKEIHVKQENEATNELKASSVN